MLLIGSTQCKRKTKNLSSSARDLGSIPGQGTKIPHASGQLSQRDTGTEPMCSGVCTLQQKDFTVKKKIFLR